MANILNPAYFMRNATCHYIGYLSLLLFVPVDMQAYFVAFVHPADGEHTAVFALNVNLHAAAHPQAFIKQRGSLNY